MKTYKTIDEYMKDVPAAFLPKMKELWDLARKLVPGGEGAIRYGMPTIQVNGKNLIHFAAMKGHIGFYPTPSGVMFLKSELEKKGIDFSKGCIRFSHGMPLPISIISKVIKFRVQEERTPHHAPSKKNKKNHRAEVI